MKYVILSIATYLILVLFEAPWWIWIYWIIFIINEN